MTATIDIPENVDLEVVKTVLAKMGVTFKNVRKSVAKKEKPYNPEFVAMIEKGRQQIREGKVQKISIDDLWK